MTAETPLDAARAFTAGLVHPLGVPAHVLALVSAALLIGQSAPLRPRLALASFVAGLALGFAAMIRAFAFDWAEESLLAAALLGGALVALARPLPSALPCALVSAMGAALALDSPPDVLTVREANIVVLGTLCGASAAVGALAQVTALLRRDWQRTGLRILGSWIAASAALVLALRLS